MRSKIVYIVSTLARCGPTNQLYGIITNLDKDKFEPLIITLSLEGSDSDKQKFIKAGINIISLELSKLQGVFLLKNKLLRLIYRHKPSVIHTSGLRADSIVSSINHKSIHFSTIRCYPYEEYTGLYGNIVGKFFAAKHINVIKKTQNPIACSKAISDILKKNHAIDIEYVQNGIDDKRFKNSGNKEKIELRKTLNLDVDKRIFIMSGSLIQRKNPLFAVECFKKANLNNSKLVVVGDGELMQKCKSYSNEDVLYLGNVKNIEDYLNASDIIVSTSYSEGLPNSILEAMSCGNCLLVSDIPQHKEILDVDSNMGDKFSLEDKHELIKLFQTYEQTDINSKKKSAYEALKNNFTASIMSHNYRTKYIDAINEKINIKGNKTRI